MTDMELDTLMRKLKNLWSAWSPSDDEAAIWAKRLKQLPYSTTDAAIEEHYGRKQGSYTSPRLYQIVELSRDRLGKPGHKLNLPVIAYQLQCVQAGMCRAGTIKSFFIPADKGGIGDERFLRAAEKAQKKAEQLYGGSWLIFRNWEEWHCDAEGRVGVKAPGEPCEQEIAKRWLEKIWLSIGGIGHSEFKQQQKGDQQ